MRKKPISDRMRRKFEAHGCRFTEERVNANTGEPLPDGATPPEGTIVMHPVYAADGSYIGDANYGNHFRWLARHGIFCPMLATPDGRTASLGRATVGPNAGKWVGWSHRAAAAFGVGSEVKEGHCGYRPERGEWKALTDDDAKQMAIDFAKSVS